MKIDRYESNVQVDRVPVNPGSMGPVTANSGAGAVQDGLAHVSNALSDVATLRDHEAAKADDAVAKQKELAYTAEASDLLRNSEKGYLTTQGEKALDTKPVHDKLEELRQKYMGELTTERSIKTFDARTKARQIGFSAEVEDHAGKARKEVYARNAEGMLDQMIKGSVARYNDPDQVEAEIQLGVPTLYKHFKEDLGMSEEQSWKAVKAAEAKVYDAVLAEYKARGQFAAGQKYLVEQYGGEIQKVLGEGATKWRESFRELTDVQENERMAGEAFDAIRSANVNEVNGRFDQDGAIEALRKLPPEIRAKVEKDVEHNIALEAGKQKEADVQRLARLSSAVRAAGGKLDRTSDDFRQLDDEGKAKAEALEYTVRRQLKSDAHEDRRIQADNDSIAIDTFLSQPPEDQADMTDEQISGTYTDASDRAIARIKRYRQVADTARKNGMSVHFGQFHTEMQSYAARMPKAKGKEFMEGMIIWYGQFQTENKGKAPMPEQVIKEVGSRVLQLNVPGTILTSTKYAFETPNAGSYPRAADQKFRSTIDAAANASLSTHFGKPPVATTPSTPTVMSGKDLAAKFPGFPWKPASQYDRVPSGSGKFKWVERRK